MAWATRIIIAVVWCCGIHGHAAALPEWSSGPGFRVRPVDPGPAGKVGFTSMGPAQTGVLFTNVLRGDAYLTNAVAHNGAGVAIGDIDADGWPDLYFCSLQGPNRLYRNLGDWHFEEIPAGPADCADQMSTAAALADIDGDGDLDLLVNGIAVGTRLFLNDGQGHWTEASNTGLSRTNSATAMALADMDGDGDLDLYCSHYIDAMLLADPTTRFALAKRGDQWEITKVNGESTRSPRWQARFEALPDGRVRELPEVHGLYRNEGHGHFAAIQFEPGTYANEAGKPIPPYRDWGLGVMFRDLNRDGIPDLYVCNDNTSPDRIWINSGKGTFRACPTFMFRHTSRSSMSLDFADLNRDGYDDLIVVDMLARQPAKRMTQLVRDRPNPLESERTDERPQFNRNTLFFGRPDGTFVEAALIAGVAATDWTWSPIFLDVDLDGYEDLLVTNGFEFDVMDQDSSNEIKDSRRRFSEAQLKRSMQFHPTWRTRNAAFRNRRDGTFEPVSAEWGFDRPGISFGMALGDLDNDGDLDVVLNNLNEAATLYRNDAPGPRIAVRLRGNPPNTQGTSARLTLTGRRISQSQEMLCAGRYLSCDQATRVFAVDPDAPSPMTLRVRWRSGKESAIPDVQTNRVYEISEDGAGPPTEATPPRMEPVFQDASSLINHQHAEDPFDDWGQQPLLPRRLSHLGPGIAWFDLNGDGWEDLLIPAARGGRLVAYQNEEGVRFRKSEGPVAPGDQGAVVGWSNGQGDRRLLIAVSNDGGGANAAPQLLACAAGDLTVLQKLTNGLASPGPIATADIDGDGDLDVVVGGRFRSGRYPEPVSSRVYLNQGGQLQWDASWSKSLESIGLVAGAVFADFDGDGFPDLALSMEWGPIRLYLNKRDHFEDMTAAWGLTNFLGWWTGIAAGDFDGDGIPDLACGNWGRNSIHELQQPTDFRLFYGDWGGNGALGMIEAWQAGTNWFPERDRSWLARGLPELAAQFPTHQAFAAATIGDLLGTNRAHSAWLEVNTLSSMVFLNRRGRFTALPLSFAAQLAPCFAVAVGEMDGDGTEDLFLSQNFFGTGSDLSRDDGGCGLWLRGQGNGTFEAVDPSVSGIKVMGEQRAAALADFNHDGRTDLVITQNNGPTKLYLNRGARRGLRVLLQGPPANPEAIGTQLRIVYPNGQKGPVRTIQAGSGYWSQDAAVPVLGLRQKPAALWLRWPGGGEQTVSIPENEWTIRAAFKP